MAQLTTKVVNLRRDSYDVYIGRAGQGHEGYFGNPFTEAEYGGAAVEHFRVYFLERLHSDADFRQRVDALKGKTLGCFCKPRKCHGDVIVEYLEGKNMNREVLKKDRHHLTLSGTFQSDKFKWCPPGFVPLKMKDTEAVKLLRKHGFLAPWPHDIADPPPSLPRAFVLVSLDDPIGRMLLREYAPIRAKVDAEFGRDLLEAIKNKENEA